LGWFLECGFESADVDGARTFFTKKNDFMPMNAEQFIDLIRNKVKEIECDI
jgi:hypothetical protein